jgi:hypothetical protein
MFQEQEEAVHEISIQVSVCSIFARCGSLFFASLRVPLFILLRNTITSELGDEV